MKNNILINALVAVLLGIGSLAALADGVDLLMVDGNPFEDIRHTVRIDSVWKNGFRVDRGPG